MSSLPWKNIFLALALRRYAKANIKDFLSCIIFLYFLFIILHRIVCWNKLGRVSFNFWYFDIFCNLKVFLNNFQQKKQPSCEKLSNSSVLFKASLSIRLLGQKLTIKIFQIWFEAVFLMVILTWVKIVLYSKI